jgi:uncharacterized protein (TIGR02679 family)
MWADALDALEAAGLESWAVTWISDLRRGGTLSRLPPAVATALLHQAIAILARLPAGAVPSDPAGLGISGGVTVGRAELAVRHTGSAHGLDDDTLLSRLVLRALALRHGVALPGNAGERRGLWAAAGVTVDGLSTTVLTYGLRPLGADAHARWLADRSDAGLETHLTARDLPRWTVRLPRRTRVYVCENPRVVEAAADERRPAALVCTSGNPSTVTLALLDALAAAGALLSYHGDFDWPGIAIAARLIARLDATPWRFGAADYASAVATARDRGTPLLPLTGDPVDAPWDPGLTSVMRATDAVIHEESVLELLLDDLTGRSPS